MSKYEERIFRVDNIGPYIDFYKEYFHDFLWEIVSMEYYPSRKKMDYIDFTCRRDLTLPRIDEIIRLEKDYDTFNYLMDKIPILEDEDFFFRLYVDTYSDAEDIQKQARIIAADIRRQQR